MPLVEVTRGEMVESIHYGAIAVTDNYGYLLYSCGNAEKMTYFRSSAKPLQVLPFVEMGGMEVFGLTDRELAIMCASHSGTDEHVRVLEEMQRKIGLTERDLLCGVHMPLDKPTAQAMEERSEEPTPNRNNCSGKHIGMLAQALLLNAPKEDYINPQHPVQKAILKVVSEMCGLEPEQVVIGIDGCSVPVFAIPLQNAALAYARLADPSMLSETRAVAVRRIVKAMMTYPDMVAGPERFDTLLMQAGRRKIMTKMGAEGFQGISILPGASNKNTPAMGISLKIADGDVSGRAVPVVTLEILRQFGALSQEMTSIADNFGAKAIYNFAHIKVGEIKPCFKLEAKEVVLGKSKS